MPPPSRPVGLTLKIVAGVTAFADVGRALLYFRRANIDRQLEHGSSTALSRSLHSTVGALQQAGLLTTGGLVAVVILWFVWRDRRRPRAARITLGEAAVESPLRWVTPVWIRLLLVAPIVATFVLGAGTTRWSGMPLGTAATYYDHLAYGSLLWAGSYAMVVVYVVMADRALDRRIAAAPVAHLPGPVPFYPAVNATQPVRVGWVMRTAGLTIGLIVCLPVSVVAFVAGINGEAAAWGWFVVAAAGDVAILSAYARRIRTANAR